MLIAQLEPLWLEISAPLDRLQGVQPGGVVEIPPQLEEPMVDFLLEQERALHPVTISSLIY